MHRGVAGVRDEGSQHEGAFHDAEREARAAQRHGDGVKDVALARRTSLQRAVKVAERERFEARVQHEQRHHLENAEQREVKGRMKEAKVNDIVDEVL